MDRGGRARGGLLLGYCLLLLTVARVVVEMEKWGWLVNAVVRLNQSEWTSSCCGSPEVLLEVSHGGVEAVLLISGRGTQGGGLSHDGVVVCVYDGLLGRARLCYVRRWELGLMNGNGGELEVVLWANCGEMKEWRLIGCCLVVLLSLSLLDYTWIVPSQCQCCHCLDP